MRENKSSRLEIFAPLALALGPFAFICLTQIGYESSLSQEARAVAGLTFWMAIWWVSEVVPIPITAVLPLIVFPVSGVMEVKQVSGNFGHPLIYLFWGGFVIAIAMEKCGLHRRTAIAILKKTGTQPQVIVFGFMLAAAMLSMWVTNTATTMMLLPIALSIGELFQNEEGEQNSRRFSLALLLGLAYASSIGGLGTIVGTVPNALAVSYLEEAAGIKIDFITWMMFAVPLVVILLPVVWFLLVRIVFPMDGTRVDITTVLEQSSKDLGAVSRQEKFVAAVFVLTASLWIFRPLLNAEVLPAPVSDTSIAVLGAVLLFAVPVEYKPLSFVMTWSDAGRLPWDLLLLFGGGLALASGIKATGLSDWIGSLLLDAPAMLPLIIVLLTVMTIIFLTELTSNTATTAAFLPVIGTVAMGLGMWTPQLVLPAAIAASCAFMLPVATPPNAIVYGSGKITIGEMMRAGFLLNLVVMVVLVIYGYYILPLMIK